MSPQQQRVRDSLPRGQVVDKRAVNMAKQPMKYDRYVTVWSIEYASKL